MECIVSLSRRVSACVGTFALVASLFAGGCGDDDSTNEDGGTVTDSGSARDGATTPDSGPVVSDGGGTGDGGGTVSCAGGPACGACETCGPTGCVPVDDGTACGDGACYAGSCCTGCWDGSACQSGTTLAMCGNSGEACSTCSNPSCANVSCATGACMPAAPVEAFSLGGFSTCAVAAGGSLWCWGQNSDDELGLGSEAPSAVEVPTQVGTESWITVGLGEDHGCGIRQNGTLWCWGNNEDGQLGVGDTTNRDVPTQEALAATNWVRVLSSAVDQATCGLRQDGSMYCWGDNSSGQLGLGDSDNRDTPTQVAGTWLDVSVGNAHICGIRMGGTLWCWGDNEGGQLGQGDTTNVDSPAQVGTDTNWKDVSAGADHTCAIRMDGTLWCWGDNSNGALGTGGGDDQTTPVQIGADNNWDSIVSEGNRFNCGLRTEGTLWCWGRNFRGPLGLGDTSDRNAPEQVGTDTDWASVNIGRDHACALKDDGVLECVGRNFAGGLGIGDTDDRTEHVAICFPSPS